MYRQTSTLECKPMLHWYCSGSYENENHLFLPHSKLLSSQGNKTKTITRLKTKNKTKQMSTGDYIECEQAHLGAQASPKSSGFRRESSLCSSPLTRVTQRWACSQASDYSGEHLTWQDFQCTLPVATYRINIHRNLNFSVSLSIILSKIQKTLTISRKL